MKDKWRNYALKDGKVKSSYIREHCYRSPKRERREASRRNSLLESGEEQPKVEEKVDPNGWYGKEVIVTEPVIINDEWVSLALNQKEEEENGKESSDSQGERRTCKRSKESS